MKITVHVLAADNDNGTNATAHATEEAARRELLVDCLESSEEEMAEWIAEDDGKGEEPRDLWSFVSAHSDHLDTYNLLENSVDFDLVAQPLPATDRERVAEALECLARARDLLMGVMPDSHSEQTKSRAALDGTVKALALGQRITVEALRSA